MPRLVHRRDRDLGQGTIRAAEQIAGEDVAALSLGVRVRLAADDGARDREGAGIRRVLQEALLAVEATDVERESGGAEEHHE